MPEFFGRDARVNLLINTGHFLSHFYLLCVPLMFLSWQQSFGVTFAELGLSSALMAAATGLLQTPVGFLVDRFGARPFLIGGLLVMTLSMAAMALATAYWQILLLSLLSGIGNSVIHPSDYAVLTGSVNRARMGRAFALHTFSAAHSGLPSRWPPSRRNRVPNGPATDLAGRQVLTQLRNWPPNLP